MSYSVKKVIEIIEKCKLAYPTLSMKIEIGGLQNSGCWIIFDNINCVISIQTHPMITNGSFCETALKSKNEEKILKLSEFNYDYGILRHDKQSDLEQHLKFIFDKLYRDETSQFADDDIDDNIDDKTN